MNCHNQNTPAANRVGRKFKNDLIFITVLLAVVSLLGLAFFFFRGEGDVVTVTVDGAVYGTYSLSEPIRVEIRTGDEQEQINVLVIEDGRAYVEHASCPDGICAAHKPILRNGESIVCLPHRVVITVHKTDGQNPDIIV